MKKELLIEAKRENLKQVVSFLQDALPDRDYPPSKRKQVRLCVEEVFMNIARHAYGGEGGCAQICADRVKKGSRTWQTEISFIDDGPPFDPLSAESPDLNLSLEEMPVGGLGIFLVRSVADQVNYEYRNGKNILTLRINDPVPEKNR